MLSVMFSCPITRQAVYAGIETDELSFTKVPDVECCTSSPARGREHLRTNRKAWLLNGGWLAPIERLSEPALPLKQIA